MDIQTLEQLLDELERSGGTVRKVITTEPAAVVKMEQLLRLKFPESVRSFYSLYEYLQVGSYEFVWAKTLPDLVNRVRAQHPDLPNHCLPVLVDGMGGYYYVVCAEMYNSRPRDFGFVVHHTGAPATPFELSSTDFLEFVASRVERAINELEQ